MERESLTSLASSSFLSRRSRLRDRSSRLAPLRSSLSSPLFLSYFPIIVDLIPDTEYDAGYTGNYLSQSQARTLVVLIIVHFDGLIHIISIPKLNNSKSPLKIQKKNKNKNKNQLKGRIKE
jgi:hypothetical protein